MKTALSTAKSMGLCVVKVDGNDVASFGWLSLKSLCAKKRFDTKRIEKIMLTDDDYYRAILIQDAGNLSGIVHTWSKLMSKIFEEARAIDEGTAWVNTHPINVLFASKVASLTGCESIPTFSEAYEECLKRAGKDLLEKNSKK